MPAVRIEYFRTDSGREPVRDFLDELPELPRRLCEYVIDYLASGEIDQRPRHREYVADGIWELRITFQGNELRILYALEGDCAILLHGFKKKTRRTPDRAIALAKQRRAEWRKRREQP